MYLIEHKYLPKHLNNIIIPNKRNILDQINKHITQNKMNILLIGSHYTLKNNIITLIVQEYYNLHNIHNYSRYILNIDE